jgi:hypothetical protein
MPALQQVGAIIGAEEWKKIVKSVYPCASCSRLTDYGSREDWQAYNDDVVVSVRTATGASFDNRSLEAYQKWAAAQTKPIVLEDADAAPVKPSLSAINEAPEFVPPAKRRRGRPTIAEKLAREEENRAKKPSLLDRIPFPGVEMHPFDKGGVTEAPPEAVRAIAAQLVEQAVESATPNRAPDAVKHSPVCLGHPPLPYPDNAVVEEIEAREAIKTGIGITEPLNPDTVYDNPTFLDGREARALWHFLLKHHDGESEEGKLLIEAFERSRRPFDMKIKVDWFKDTGKWYAGQEILMDRAAAIDRDLLMRLIIERQTELNANWVGDFDVVISDIDMLFQRNDYKTLFSRIIYATDWWPYIAKKDENSEKEA